MKLNPTTIINALSHAVIYSVTAILVIIALVVSAVRWYPNVSTIAINNIESRLGEIINADIQIASLDISRNKLLSEIVVQDIKIIDRQNPDNVWQLEKAKLAVDITASLLARSLRIKEVILEGMDVSLQRDAAGDVHVNQLFLVPGNKLMRQSRGASQGGQGLDRYANVKVALLNTNLQWSDAQSQTEYSFADIDIAIEPTRRGHDVSLSGQLPGSLGKSLQAYVKIDGDVAKLVEADIEFYLKTEQLQLDEIARYILTLPDAQLPMVVDSEVWGVYSAKHLQSLRGTVRAEQIVGNPDHIATDLCLSDDYIQQLSMNFDWQQQADDWHFLANNVAVVSAQRDWPENTVHLKMQKQSANVKTLLGYIEEVDLGAVCNTLHTYSPHIIRFEDKLKHYRIAGEVDDLFIRVDLVEGQQPTYQYSAQFNDMAAWMSQGNRKVNGLSGSLKGGDAGGEVVLDASHVSLDLPQQFPGFDVKFAAQGAVRWTHLGASNQIDAESLRIHNDDVSLSARIHATLTAGELYTDSQVYVDRAKANAVGNYFPLFVKTQRTKKWLTDAIHKGEVAQASVLLRGDMRTFPFHQSSGVFQTDVDVKHGVLEYMRDWPQLNDVEAKVLIDKQHINIRSTHATTMNSSIKRVDINIANFLRSVMRLNGVVDGPAKDLQQFLGASGLVKKTNSVVDQITLQGDSRLEVDFSRSLSRKVNHPVQVSGNVNFLGNTLTVNKVGVTLNDLAGKVAFDAEGATGENVIATVYGNPIDISVHPEGAGASSLKFTGDFDIDEYLTQQYPQYASLFDGTANIQGDLHVPSFFAKNNPDKLRLVIHSDMVGVESRLPEPLAKDKPTTQHATLAFDQQQGELSWRIPDVIGLYFALQPKKPLALRLIDLDAAEPGQLTGDGLLLTGSCQLLAPEEWLETYKQYVGSSPSSGSSASELPSVDVKIDALVLPQWPARNVHITGKQNNDHYAINIDSNLGRGNILIPQNKQKPIRIDMDTLIVKKSAQDKGAKENTERVANISDPRTLRPIVFSSDRLIVNELELSDVYVNALINHQGMVFDEIKLAAQDLHGTGSGLWTSNNNRHHTAFDFQLTSVDVEDSLKDLGFSSSLKKGKATASGKISWQGAPQQLALKKLSGYTQFEVTDGSVSEINPGKAGRLLALLNLGAISRRLSLDFKDVTNKGFTFDSITGDLKLSPGGELKAEGIMIKASAADIDINGWTNLVDQTYNQSISVTPAVSGTLPAAGAIVGGPVGAAAGLLVDRVAKAAGLNKVSTIEYKMTGTWKEPVLESISRAKSKTAARSTGRKSGP